MGITGSSGTNSTVAILTLAPLDRGCGLCTGIYALPILIEPQGPSAADIALRKDRPVRGASARVEGKRCAALGRGIPCLSALKHCTRRQVGPWADYNCTCSRIRGDECQFRAPKPQMVRLKSGCFTTLCCPCQAVMSPHLRWWSGARHFTSSSARRVPIALSTWRPRRSIRALVMVSKIPNLLSAREDVSGVRADWRRSNPPTP
jgi:hypothetical protein